MALEPAPGGCTKGEALSPPRDGGDAVAACKTFSLCDDRLGADGMALDDEAYMYVCVCVCVCVCVYIYIYIYTCMGRTETKILQDRRI